MRTVYLLLIVLSPFIAAAQCGPGTAGIISQNGMNSFASRTDGTILNSFSEFHGLGIGENGNFNPLVYAMAQWIGGVTSDQQLKLAADTYGVDGNDFFPGPLTVDGSASVTANQCTEYDQYVHLLRVWSEQHLAYFDCLNDPDCDVTEDFPGYEIPQAFFYYPAHGDTQANQAYYLMPFYDYDSDGAYNPSNGDCPLFGNPDDCCNTLLGDECFVWIMNDKGNIHTASGGDQIGIEQHHMLYRYYSDDFGDAVFHRTKIINRGTQTLFDTYIGHFLDPDLGNYEDDHAIFISESNTALIFNGDPNDEGSNGFGEDAPALAFRLLSGPPQDANGLDDDNDGIVDNETLGLTYGLFNDPNTIVPSAAIDYYYWLSGHYVSGQPFTEDGEQVDFQQDGFPDVGELYLPGERRLLMSSGPFTLEPSMEFCISTVLCWDFKENGEGEIDAAENVLAYSDEVQELHENCYGCVPPGVNMIAQESGDGYQFMNLSDADSYLWDFGDGTTSTEPAPFHIFEGGSGIVTLTVTNDCGSATGSVDLDLPMGVFNANAESGLSAYPQPAGEVLTVKMDFEAKDQIIRLFDAAGQLVLENQAVQGVNTINVSTLPPGVYVLSVQRQNGMIESLRVVR